MVDTPMDPIHKNLKFRFHPLKWAGLGGGQSWAFSRFGTPQGVQIKLFCYKRFSKNLKRMNINHGMYFLKIYWFRGVNHLLGAEGDPEVKSVKNDGFKNMHFCIKATITRRFIIYWRNFITYLDSSGKITLISAIKSIG